MGLSRTARTVLTAALALGFLGDHLFRAPVWGLNVALFAVVLAVRGAVLARKRESASSDRSPWPWFAAAFFAAMWTVRDAESLLAVDLLAALSLLSLPILQRRVSLRTAGVTETVLAPARAAAHTLSCTHQALAAIEWRSTVGPSGAGRARALGMGVLLTLPLVLAFGALFALADPVFGAAASTIVRFDLEPVLSHVLLAIVLAWVSAGYLWAVARPPVDRPSATRTLALPEGMFLPVVTALGATAFLFVVFLALQANSLFGGAAYIQSQTGLTFAEYARRGFFEMVTASALTLPLVHAAPFAARPIATREIRSLRALMTLQLLLTGLLLASALWRMGLYVRTYGLSEDRLYGTAIMVWVGLTVVVFARTVLVGRPQGAAFGSLVAAVATLAALNMVNPQAFIARYNLSRMEHGEIDLTHLALLGGDAVPELVSKLEALKPGARCTLAQSLVDRYAKSSGDWRGWNLARWRARRAARSIEVHCPE